MTRRVFEPRDGDRRPTEIGAQMREEVETHIAMWADHLEARGLPREDAEREARARFARSDAFDETMAQLGESARRRDASTRWRTMVSTLRGDLTFTLRQLLRRPTFTIVALLTFALGVGANTAVFSVVRAILLRPLPFRDPAALAAIWPTRLISNGELELMQRHATSFAAVGAFSPGWGIAMTRGGEPRQLDAARVSTNFFALLGARPASGRLFENGESEPGRWDIAIISHGLWRDQFGGDAGIVGRIVDMDGRPTRIIGVMPAGFEIYQQHVDAWLPLQIDRASPFYAGATAQGIGRLEDRVTFAQATADLQRLAPSIRATFAYTDDYAHGATVTGLQESLIGNVRRSLQVLFGAVVLLALIAVVNVGTLLLVDAVGRSRELAIRRALGASRARIARQLFVQSALLAVAGGALGVLVGWVSLGALKASLPASLPLVSSAQVDPGVLAFCAAAIAVAAILFGIAPAMLATRVDPEGALRGGGAAKSSRSATSTRDALVVAELALAMMLVVGAGLMTESIRRLGRVDLGFDANGVLSLLLQPSSGQAGSAEATRVYFDEMTRRIAAVPGVKVVGAAQHLPLSGFNWGGDLDLEARPLPATAAHPRVVWRSIVGDYFGAMRIPLVRGRGFAPTDTRDAPPVVVINSTMASRIWPNSDPIGQRIRLGNGTQGTWATVIGIVGDVRFESPDTPAALEAYRPNAQQALKFMHYVIRTSGNPLARVSDVRSAIRSLDGTVPIAQARALGELTSESTATRRTIAELLLAFAALGLLLGAVGLYGVSSYAVSQRQREIGIRSALGATPRGVLQLVLGEGLRLAVIGIGIGATCAALGARALDTLVFGVTTRNPVVYLVVAGVLGAIAGVAAWVPARRAARIDPLIALRGD